MSDNQSGANEEYQNNTLGELLKMLSNTQTGISNTDAPKQPDGLGASGATPSDNNPLASVMSSLMSNPDMLSKLPAIISAIKPLMESFSASSTTVSNITNQPQSASVMSHLPASENTPTPKGNDNRTELLRAMKPYLSHDRQNAIDYIIKLGRLGDILKSL